MQRSTSDDPNLQPDSLAAGNTTVRRIDGESDRLRPRPLAGRARGASSEWAFEKSAREFSRLRDALNERDTEILRLHAQASQHLQELARVKTAGLADERDRQQALDRALTSERALRDLRGELREELATERRALDSMRVAWVTAKSELAEAHSQLESTRSALSLTLDQLNSSRRELTSAQVELEALAKEHAGRQHQFAAAAAEVETTKAELAVVKNDLRASNFHLTATRAELRAMHAEFTAVQSELGESCLAMTAMRAELGSAQRELQSMRAAAASP